MLAWKKIPAIRKILDSYKAKRKLEPKPKPVKAAPPAEPDGPFTFTEPSVFWPEDYAGLDNIDKMQFRASGAAYMGGVVKSGAHFVSRLPAFELDESDREWRRWKVMRDGVHAYDVWVFWVDNATVFPARKPERAPIQMMQGDWQPMNQRAPAKALANDFGRSAPSDLWTVPKTKAKTKAKAKPTAKAKARPKPKTRVRSAR